MRCPESKVKAAILHPEVEIRYAAASYFANAYSTDCSLMPQVIEAVEKHGRDHALSMLRLAEGLVQTPATIAWLMSELQRPYDLQDIGQDNYRCAVALVLCRADPALLVPVEQQSLLEGMDDANPQLSAGAVPPRRNGLGPARPHQGAGRPITPEQIRAAKPMPKDPFDFAVQMSARIQKTPPQIELVWVVDPNATEYTICRRSGASGDFGKPLATLPGTATSWLDKNVAVGQPYEYRVDKKFRQLWNEQMTDFAGFGVLYAGIEKPLEDLPGKVVLVVDKSQAEALAAEIARLQDDLVGDGWEVLRHDVAPNDAVTSVKALIEKDYQADPKHVQAVLLLGHVPIPYAGDITWHHRGMFDGAYPADVYYGSIAGKWTDTEVNDIKGGEKSHRNVPGDGKFDQGQLTAPAELMVGRIDAHGLDQNEHTKMHLFPTISESDLLRRYLDKDHRWRQAQIKAQSRALYFCHEPATVAFMGEPYRYFAATVGAENITNDMWLPTLTKAKQKEPFLFAWGFGGAGDIHVNFATADITAVFTEVGGSGILDWVLYPHLRSPIFSPSYTLSCNMTGAGCKHYMGLGETLGFSMRQAQNKTWPAGAREMDQTWVFTALMGDPTLRLHPVPTVGELKISAPATLAWKAPLEREGVVGYHVYRAAAKAGPYTRLTRDPAQDPRFADPQPAAGNWYMVRTVKLQTSPSGSYFAAAAGAFVQAP